MPTTRVEIVTIGDELLLGFTLDTNGAHLARELAAIGIEVVRRVSVRDDAGEIAAAVGEALERTGAVITTGGLGRRVTTTRRRTSLGCSAARCGSMRRISPGWRRVGRHASSGRCRRRIAHKR